MINMFNKDCMEGMGDTPDKYYDLAIIDPPYNIVSKQKRGIGSRIDASGKMNGWNHSKPEKIYFDELFRVSKNQIIFGANNYSGLPATEYFIIWDKSQTVENFATAEYAWVSSGIGKPAKIFRYGIHKHNSSIQRIHPTQKPVQLYKWLLKNYSKEGDKILDTHGGSGSICIACHDMGFDLDWYEIDGDYYKDAKKRFEVHTSQLQLKF